jgi:hypothetical protein
MTRLLTGMDDLDEGREGLVEEEEEEEGVFRLRGWGAREERRDLTLCTGVPGATARSPALTI